jgi:cytochrome c oxidase subunit II
MIQPERVEVYVDDAAAPAQVLTAPPFQLSLDTTTLPDGAHTVRVITHFSDGRSRERRVAVVVENHPMPLPEVGLEGLAEDDLVAGVIHATVTLEPRPSARRTRASVVLYPVVIAAVLAGVWAVFALATPSRPPSTTGGSASTTPSAAPAGRVVASPEAIKAGAVQFHALGCTGCHMVAGKGGTAGPDLTHIGATLSRASMSETITHGNGQMPPFSTIKPADLSALLDYLQSLK